MAKHIQDAVKQFIEQNNQKGNNTICVLSPFCVDATEGYMQRVLAIDSFVFAPLCCVHLDFENLSDTSADKKKVTSPYCQKVDERHLVVNLLPHCKKSAKLALEIAKLCRVLYIHSAIRCKENIIGNVAERLLKQKGVYKIWDVHGALPEEYVMQLNFLEAQHATKAEELLLENADCTLIISDAMAKHYEKKYSKKLVNPINTGVFTSLDTNIDELIAKKPTVPPYNIIYAGNTMVWQNVPLMKQTIEKCGEQFRFTVFTHDIDDFNRQQEDAVMPNSFSIDSVTIERVFEEYEHCHFGFALRDDSPVNNVATPTKIIEYIRFGIIPILKSDRIGDLVPLKLRYISYVDLPFTEMSFDEYKKIVVENHEILKKMEKIRDNGIGTLKKTIAARLR